MNEGFETDAGRNTSHNGNTAPGNARTNGHAHRNGQAVQGGFDVWTVADILTHRWHWLVIGGILGAAAFFALGWVYLIKPKFTATVQLLRYEPPGGSDAITGSALSTETFASLIASPDLLREVGAALQPPIPPERLVKQMKIDPQPDSDLVKVLVAAGDPASAVKIANLYAERTVAYTKDLQSKKAAELANNYLKQQVLEMDKDIGALQNEFKGSAMPAPISNKLEEVSGNLNALNANLALTSRPSLLTLRLSEKLQTSLAELSELTSKYTDLHPAVVQKRDQINLLQEQIKSSAQNTDPLSPTGLASIGPGGQNAYDPNRDLIHGKLRALEDARIGLANRQREAELYASNPPGMVRVFAPANLKTVQSNHRRLKTGIVTIFGGCMGMALSLGLILLTEAFDRRLRTADDLKRVTKLPVLTTLGDLNSMAEKDRTQWAFRSWTRLQGKLSRSQNHGLVCGITSSSEGEGRSTWIKLLSEAASLSGFRVLTIATRPSTHIGSPPQLTDEPANEPAPMNSREENQVATISSNVLATPAQVTEQLTDPNSQPVVHIPLPGWVWNLDRRREWRDALEQWKQIDNLVIFVELPPASIPEAVLLGSNLPNVIWLADSGTADAAETRAQIQTLRDARANLVGAVLNRATNGSLKSHFPRWMGCLAVLAMLMNFSGQAQTSTLPVEAPPEERQATPALVTRTNLGFSVTSPIHRAEWQQRLTLGPGDVLSFGLYGEPLLNRMEVAVGPDGRVSYLEAQDILVTGLTVDELRQRFDDELGKFRRVARTMITPVTFKSKKYYVLGKVVQRGVYTLDRPTTVIEAIARAKGLENGLVDNNTVDLADLSRSFLMRRGERIPLNFEKLFNQGDLSQNIQIEPDDYLYFPSGSVQEIYVVGEVGLPGMVVHRPDSTTLTAIANRGGFNEKAFKSRVLVIRGSLNNPETFVVDALGVMNGRSKDMTLQPRDIVYVSHRPFYKAEDLLDMATVAFIQSIVTTWVSADVLSPVD
ncbi:MAG TPA: polysaccharide biosynthesis/export family protein [Verrucomicrobiae bacterium]|nr:polysaccharide biosynthesis/export family protein [Verrucomicrobiae bacterium]